MENNIQNTGSTVNQEQQSSLSVRDVLDFIWRLRYFIAASAFACLLLSFVYVRMQDKVFERSAWILLTSDDGTNSELSMLSQFAGGKGVKKKIDNEIFILKTPTMASKVIDDLGLNYRYFRYGKPVADRFNFSLFNIKSYEYYKNSPFEMVITNDELYPESMRPNSISIKFTDKGNNEFTIKEMTVNGAEYDAPNGKLSYGSPIELEGMSVAINVKEGEAMTKNSKYLCTWSTPIVAARNFLKRFSADILTTTSKYDRSDIIEIKMTDTQTARAEDFINTLIDKANEEARHYSTLGTMGSIKFIDQRLQDIAGDLKVAETNYKNYQSSKTLVDLSSQSQATIAADQQYQDRLNEVNIQLALLEMVNNSLKDDPSEPYKVLPANLGLNDAGLNATLTNYNEKVADRSRLINNSSESNPRVISLSAQLDELKKAIAISIENLNKVYNITRNELTKTLNQSRNKMTSIPQQQFELQQLSRKLDVIEPLYLMLQQKREEAQIKMYSEVDNFRVLEYAFGDPKPISPKSAQIYLLALILGACLPLGVVWVRMQLKDKVETKEDVTKVLDTPVLATLPKADQENGVLIKEYGRDTSSESFRMLRSNLKYVGEVKVIQVTSSIPGEGKSYVSSNLALSLAHLGKKVVIVGMDIRKPTLANFFKSVKVDSAHTVVGYLIGKSNDIDSLPAKCEEYSGLDVILAGPVPPNPTELLELPRVAELIEGLRARYDYVVIDSAPYMPVPDSSIINKHVDVTAYVLRAEHTRLDLLPQIKELMSSTTAPIKSPKLVINGLDLASNKYHYGYGKGYGYGYGYGGKHGYGYGNGYGYGYGEGHSDKGRS